ncbi:MAG TPA: hypothetical protein VMR44_10300 [Thermoanaerobaculia bacterium]|nr:hypothetical protein [Thermoanaerobaculia bacterium]
MSLSAILPHLQGPFSFLRPEEEELRRIVAAGRFSLPRPQPIYLEDEGATPLQGFPVLVSDSLRALRESLIQYVLQEESSQVGILRRAPGDRKAYGQAWESYRAQLCRAVENSTVSSHGRHFPELFWLHHSLDLAALLKETPRRVTRADPELGRSHGDEIRFRVYDRYVDRLQTAMYDLVQRVAAETDELEEEIFPRLLTRMVDNVLVFTEDHISPNLGELNSYFAGHLRLDGRDLRQRLEALAAWHRARLAEDGELGRVVRQLLGGDPDSDRDLMVRCGYVTYLAGLPGYDAQTLLPGPLVQVWERLLWKLKEFELFHALRRLAVPVQRSGDRFVTSRDALNRTLVGRTELPLSSTTRPYDFTAPWVVDPQVHRFGMIYDISDFSDVVEVLRRSGAETQDNAFREMFRFQRRVNLMADGKRLKLEKYLGDGAFYSSRRGQRLLVAAIGAQRLYAQALAGGFPFDRGIRIALNHGQYRLIPIHVTESGADRYEFFGHGLVELSRLTTGKAIREIEEIRTMLVNLGYREDVVHRFFAPVLERNVDTIDRQEEARRFHAYVNRNGYLVNEGIVATAQFLEQLDAENRFEDLRRAVEGDRRYVAIEAIDRSAAGGPPGRTPARPGKPAKLVVGLRKLGVASLKGLERLPVFEVVDLGHRSFAELDPMHGPGLMAAIERELAAERQGRQPAVGSRSGS